MACFGGGYRDAHGFSVAHFAHNDDIGGLAQGSAEALRELAGTANLEDAFVKLIGVAGDLA